MLTNCSIADRSKEAIEKWVKYLDSLPEPTEWYNNPVEFVEDPFDLNNLRFSESIFCREQKKKINLTPKLVLDYIEKIRQIKPSDKTFVIWIWTGWTISMSPTWPNWSLEPDLDFDSIMMKSDPRLLDDFEVLWMDAFSTDSSQLEIDDIWDLAIAISYIYNDILVNKYKYKDPNLINRFWGFFIVHGTDTMPKSWSHLEMMLGKNIPFNIVHIWAQKTINEKINDAERNVKEWLYTLKMLKLWWFSDSLTVMWWIALLTAGMTKVSDHNARAMDTFMHRYVIDFNELPDPDDPEEFPLPTWLRKYNPSEKFFPIVYRWPNRVQDIPAEMQEDKRVLIAITRFWARKALLLVTYWANTYDINSIELIWKEAKKQWIMAFAVSPVNADPKFNVYAATEAMVKAWVTPLYMTREAARAKIMRACAVHWNKVDDIIWFMTTNLLWEIPNIRSKRIY